MSTRLIEDNVYRIECTVDNILQPYLRIEAQSDDHAVGCAVHYFSKLPGNEGKKVVAVSVTPIDFDNL